MVNIYNNKEAFLRIKPHKIGLLVITFVLLFTIIIVISVTCYTYDYYSTKGYVTCDELCTITTIIPSNIEYAKIKINNKEPNYEELNKELKVDKENFISYYEITLKTDLPFQDSEIVNLNFYYHKQRIISKIIEFMF